MRVSVWSELTKEVQLSVSVVGSNRLQGVREFVGCRATAPVTRTLRLQAAGRLSAGSFG